MSAGGAQEALWQYCPCCNARLPLRTVLRHTLQDQTRAQLGIARLWRLLPHHVEVRLCELLAHGLRVRLRHPRAELSSGIDAGQ